MTRPTRPLAPPGSQLAASSPDSHRHERDRPRRRPSRAVSDRSEGPASSRMRACATRARRAIGSPSFFGCRTPLVPGPRPAERGQRASRWRSLLRLRRRCGARSPWRRNSRQRGGSSRDPYATIAIAPLPVIGSPLAVRRSHHSDADAALAGDRSRTGGHESVAGYVRTRADAKGGFASAAHAGCDQAVAT